MSRIYYIALVLFLLNSVTSENKYSKEANMKKLNKEPDVDFRTIHKPFRMAKLNLLWTKAQQRLTQTKLASLHSDLMIHDKEEITLKRLKSAGGDKDGLREASTRKKLIGIMSTYGLLEHFDDIEDKKKHKDHEAYNGSVDDHINRSLFKDKKLAMLWTKAEVSGFTPEELSALKEEFQHHQDKIDQYYALLHDVESGPGDDHINAVNEDDMNELDSELAGGGGGDGRDAGAKQREYLHKANLVRSKHTEVRDHFDKLQRITARGPRNKEFLEPKVQGLWKMAMESNFTRQELDSLKTELQHYEARLLKLRHLHADHITNLNRHAKTAGAGEKVDHFEDARQTIKKHERKVEKLRMDIENRILERHSEL